MTYKSQSLLAFQLYIKNYMRILIAQNDSNVTEKIQNNFKAEGFDVDVVSDGEEALSSATEGEFSAIILDILLEKINGFDVCESIRDENNNTPILMLTNKSTSTDEVDSLESGANDFLRIPFSMPVLIARIRVLLRMGNKGSQPDIKFGAFSYDEKNGKLFFDEQEIPLTFREGKVIETLIRAEGDVVSKQSLINQVWGADFDGDPNVVHVYIGYLRRKIRAVKDNTGLQTIRGRGYRLVNE